MCGLCGVVGGTHWAETLGGPPERLARVAALNRVLAVYGLTATDWRGTAYLLSDRSGRTEIATDMMHLWRAAETMLDQACDPLDPRVMARLGETPLGEMPPDAAHLGAVPSPAARLGGPS
jgi:hypothetical protein